ncbi:hypothetical protein BU204_35590 [Actinophytocola xanthii]|uniref:Uncharacterized protein n=2 Tax=Actinophytocola xanthii TaxID=1912961 RepID=A0A1Q8BZB5_9PSEU|nr:hypothetical protein BU204_35590 [Actinophytocola xanthii]
MRKLGDLVQVEDGRLGRQPRDPASAFAATKSDDEINDGSLLGNAESFDEWLVRGFVYEGAVTIVTGRDPWSRDLVESSLVMSTVPLGQYRELYDAAYSYWMKTQRAG